MKISNRKSFALAVLLLPCSLIALAPAYGQVVSGQQDGGDALDTVIVVGSGNTRSVSTLLPSNLEVLPPGTSAQKALNFLPGVNAGSIDPLGVNEQSMTLQVRGFSSTHLGYTLDGMPLGDGSYNNYNGLSISRALISENLGRADLATGIAGLGIASTSNLGGAVMYASSDPRQEMGFKASQSVGSDNGQRTFVRIDSGDYDGFSAYLSGQYVQQDLFVNQGAYNTSYEKQLNGKAEYVFNGGKITAYGDVSVTNQADDPYISQDMISRLGWDVGGVAPDWQSYLTNSAYCTVTAPAAPAGKCVALTSPKPADITYTNGQILRDDAMFYVSGDYALSDAATLHLQAYHHDDKGDGNNFITGWSTQGTPSAADDIPVQMRDTRYTINRNGILGNVAWDVGFNHIKAGFWLEENISSAARYIWTNVTGPYNLDQFQPGAPSTAQFDQKTNWHTEQYYLQDTVSLFDDAVNVDFGFKSSYAKSDAMGLPGISVVPAPSASAAGTTQFATGSLLAKDNFLPEAGVRWTFAPGQEVFASYAKNMAMYQGGFKLGPQSVSQTVWAVQGPTLKPETSQNFEAGYRYVDSDVQLSLSLYHVQFNNRLLQYNPCPTALQSNPGCGNSFHNAGNVTSNGAELGVLWQALPWLSWYNSASLNQTKYDQNLNWCDTKLAVPGNPNGCFVYATAGKQQVDTPKTMFSSVLSVKYDGLFASLQGKFTGRRYYTYTNDQSFGSYTTFDLGMGYDFGAIDVLRDAKLALNITNLTDVRYAANFDNSVFAPTDPAHSIIVAHASAPREFFVTFSAAY